MVGQVYWHWPTFIMFICMGFLLTWAFNVEKKMSYISCRGMKVLAPSYSVFYIVWLIIGIYRLVDGYHGGTDTPTYIEIFLNIYNPSYSDSIDIAFKFINMVVRFFTSDYHILLLVVYTIMLISYIKFINTYSISLTSTVPLFLVSYLYYVGFSSMRSNLAFCLLLIALSLYIKKCYKFSILFAICSCFTHVSLFMYAPVLLFCYVLRNFNIKVWHIPLALFISFNFGLFLQQSFLSGAFGFLDNVGSGAYASYAARSLDASFFDSFLVINFPPIVIAIALTFFLTDINKLILSLSYSESYILKTLLLVCIYDILLIPITFSLGVYRGYMYLMVPRLLMWGVLITIIKRKFKMSKLFVNLCFFLVFLIWIYTRFDAMHETSQLMPYIFDLF